MIFQATQTELQGRPVFTAYIYAHYINLKPNVAIKRPTECFQSNETKSIFIEHFLVPFRKKVLVLEMNLNNNCLLLSRHYFKIFNIKCSKYRLTFIVAADMSRKIKFNFNTYSQ